jgi:hypothetical protein
MFAKLSLISLFLSVLLLGACNIVTAKPIPETIIEYKYITKEVERIVTEYIEVPVEKIKYEYIYKAPKQFKDVAELDSYLKSHPAYMPAEGQDCDDIARFFMLDAMKAGFLVSTQIIDNYRGRGCHMLCSAIIGNDIYYIEPSDNSYWWAMPLD